MGRYLFTVPMRFRSEAHPLGIGPDDLLIVDAEHETLARIKVNELLGNGSWCSCYSDDDPALPGIVAKYYPGRVVDLDGDEWVIESMDRNELAGDDTVVEVS